MYYFVLLCPPPPVLEIIPRIHVAQQYAQYTDITRVIVVYYQVNIISITILKQISDSPVIYVQSSKNTHRATTNNSLSRSSTRVIA